MKFKMLPLLFLLLGISLVSCGPNRPPLSICFFSSQDRVMKCSDPKGQAFEVTIENMNGYFGLNPRDAEKLLEYVTDLEKNQKSK